MAVQLMGPFKSEGWSWALGCFVCLRTCRAREVGFSVRVIPNALYSVFLFVVL